MEDPDRLGEYRNASISPDGMINQVIVQPTDLVMDLLPPAAELTIGMQYSPTSKLSVRATIYNAIDEHSYQPDAFFDYEPHLEYLPNPYPRFRAYLSASYAY